MDGAVLTVFGELAAAAPPADGRRPGVVVLGMHRSGTSAVTRALNLLGLSVAPASDLVGAGPGNERGHWESRTLVECNELILRAAGACSWRPPPAGGAWLASPGVRALVPLCRAAFRVVHPHGPWVWKDPRTCLTAGLWLSLPAVPPAVVLVVRHPVAVARSLNARDGFAFPYCLAMWERYVRESLRVSAGLPVWITWFEELLDAPEEWADTASRFLRISGVVPDGRLPGPGLLRPYLDPRLRHHTGEEGEAPRGLRLSSEQQRLLDRLQWLTGTHRSFPPPVLPDETPGTQGRFAVPQAVTA
ncbi:sulfotransferase family protein [Streptomyces gamaensis]|uniref:Sulfotransferase family protein n=1 Tax=Streptomyces gamaensis TaxID=1763542 RepID=A0ABW0YYG5_9ACTN